MVSLKTKYKQELLRGVIFYQVLPSIEIQKTFYDFPRVRKYTIFTLTCFKNPNLMQGRTQLCTL